ncbi:MAG: FAD-dependent oxidoreductase [Gammaproteobacteria bacterium]|nr:FAD-dependent oxidoreductase [Gammaproteobacteria bacterium]
MKSIAIIGAGLAGITLASELNDKGYLTKVFEKSRGKGGRACSKRLEFAQVDTGAQYFTVRDERFLLAVESWKKQGVVNEWPFVPYVVEQLNGYSYLKESLDDISRFVGTPTMNAFVKSQATHLDIVLKTQVNKITKQADKWQLYTGTDELLGQFDWVISTAPAEQSFELFKEHIGIQQQIPSEVHNPCWAVVLATKGKVPEQIQGVFGDDQVAWVSRDSSKPQRERLNDAIDLDDVWVMHFSEKWTKANMQMPEHEMQSFALNWLADTLNNTMLLNPKQFASTEKVKLTLSSAYRHFWRYARFNDDNSNLNDIVFDRENQVAVIGDWCFGGRVENAFLSGIECAEQLMMEL